MKKHYNTLEIDKENLVNSIQLAYFCHAISSGKYPEESEEKFLTREGDIHLYFDFDCQGDLFYASWKENLMFLAIFDHESDRSFYQNKQRYLEYKTTNKIPDEMVEIATPILEAMIQDDEENSHPTLVTTCAWSFGNGFESHDTWDNFWKYGGERFAPYYFVNPEEAIMGEGGWGEIGDLTPNQMKLCLQLVKSKNVHLSSEQIKIILEKSIPEGEQVVKKLFCEMGFIWP